MFDGIGIIEIIVIALISFLFLGRDKLPQLGRELGDVIRGFRNAFSEDQPKKRHKEAKK